MTQIGFSFDLSRCSGCMACMVACFDQNDLHGAAFRHVSKIEVGAYPAAFIRFVSIACMHCADPPCVSVCPTRAIVRMPENGIVETLADRCIGCHACAMVCPFGAPQFPDGGRMQKCDFCLGRVASGLEPACARACPTRALGFGPVEELSGRKASSASALIVRSVLGRRTGPQHDTEEE